MALALRLDELVRTGQVGSYSALANLGHALRYDEGRSFAEIGAAMDRSEEAAKKLWMRAVRRLRDEMRGLHESNGTSDA
jgi:hypothetical protein